ncbi:hypothetical protein IJ843_02285 [bacterium]|nr:hypothetical protein [bacterium]
MKNRLNSFDYVIISLLSCAILCLIYHFLYNIVGYKNLNDFYVGVSIYENHNKYLDLALLPLYIFVFFIILPIYRLLPKINLKFDLPDFDFNISGILQNHKHLFMTLQTISSFGYLFLHPFNGKFYPYLSIIIFVLIGISILHSFLNLYKKEIPELSILSLIPIFIILFGQNYNFNNLGLDMHHEGEKMSVWLMHTKFNMQYYKDIMMVHGFADVIPSWLGQNIFGETSVYAGLLGRSLFDNIVLFCTVLFSYISFKKCPLLISFALFRAYNIPQLYIISFLLFLEKSFIQKPFVWIFSYIIFSFAALIFWTTYGTFWIIASLPFFVYICLKNQNKYIKLSFSIILIFTILFLNKEFLYYYAIEAANYVQSNLFVFGNDFAPLKWQQIPSDFIKLFALLTVPYFFIKLYEEFKEKNKNIEYIFALIFAVIFTCASINYTLGRIDYITMMRIRDISITYLGILIPYLLLIKESPYLKYFKYLAVIMLICLILFNIKNVAHWRSNPKPSAHVTATNSEIKNILDKYSKTDNDFLDLTNGMNYFLFNKKSPIPYVSYYNIVNTKQTKQIASIKPNVILLYTTEAPLFDNVYQSLRINKLYRNLLLNSEYSTIKTPHNLFLIKKEGTKDLAALDNYLAAKDLKFLPDVWANSLTTLPLEKVEFNYILNRNKIIFEKPVKGKNIGLIEIKTDEQNVNYEIFINGSNSFLKFKSRQNFVLFPFDNYPSWLLNEQVKTITIKTNKPVNILSVNFYSRK